MLVFHQHIMTIIAAESRILMSRAGCNDLSCGDGQDPQPNGDEHIHHVLFAQAVIDTLHDLGRRTSVLGTIADRGTGYGHKQSGRNPFS